MWYLVLFVSFSFCGIAHGQSGNKCLLTSNAGGTFQCLYYQNDTAVCDVACDNVRQGRFYCQNGGKFTPTLPKCVSQYDPSPPTTQPPAVKKCNLIANPTGYWYCYYYTGDTAVCQVYCNGNNYGYYTCRNGGSFSPSLPYCVRQTGTAPPQVAVLADPSLSSSQSAGNDAGKAGGLQFLATQNKCIVKVKEGESGSTSCTSVDDNTTCKIKCGNKSVKEYKCSDGVFTPELPSCAAQVKPPMKPASVAATTPAGTTAPPSTTK